MEKIPEEITLNNIMKSNNTDKQADETCPVGVYGIIEIRDPRTNKHIAKIPG
tara:strand:- start:987 stop:1142 length:156 start_codon:yes stop_codon:yes gene_type:complete